MTKRLSAKYKSNRRFGVNLWGRPKSPFNRRESRPGVHGQRRTKLSDYGRQLMAKQKLRFYYGNISEKQFRRYYKESVRQKGDSSENLIGLLERRLDAVVYRAKFVITVFAARQFINHGHVLVNGKKVNISSYLVKANDIISIAEKSKDLTIVIEAQNNQERELPDYIQETGNASTVTYLRVPMFSEVPYPVQMDPKPVIEYYSL